VPTQADHRYRRFAHARGHGYSGNLGGGPPTSAEISPRREGGLTVPKETLEASVDIDVPIEKVYDYVADFRRHIEWNEQPQRITPLQKGSPAVGNKYMTLEGKPTDMPLKDRLMFTVMMPIMKKIHGFGDETTSEITALDANERVAWKAHLPSKKSGDMMRMSWEIQLEERDGGTHVVQRGVINPPDESPFARMVNEDMVRSIAGGVQKNLERLKSTMESR
jgi:uncharacterized protein YndB with AHSA1/START domain